MKQIRYKILALLLAAALLAGLAGCGASGSAEAVQSALAEAAVPTENMTLPAKTIVALGEATHGNKEFTQLKQQVLQHLVATQGVRVFALEGDFGGCVKVNEYIHGGPGTAEAAAAGIGFAIYNTAEVASLIEWMRTYNQTAPAGQTLHFYGYDMQRYDNNKSVLFAFLDEVDAPLAAQYQPQLAPLNDEAVFSQDEALTQQGLAAITALIEQMEANRTAYTGAQPEAAYEIALACAHSIRQNATLRGTDVLYADTRDEYMAQWVTWILEHEGKHYQNEHIFLAGHNGHVEKTSKTMGTQKVMGQHLAEAYGDEYFAIGTEFYESSFLAADNTSGERTLFAVTNSGEARLATALNATGLPNAYIDFAKAGEDAALAEYLNTPQDMSNIGDAFSAGFEKAEAFYTLSMAPAEAYNALIWVKQATPSTMLG